MTDDDRTAVAKLAEICAHLSLCMARVQENYSGENTWLDRKSDAEQIAADFTQPQTKEPTDDT